MEKIIRFLKEKGKILYLGCILVGLVVIGVGFAMANFDIYAMQTVKHEAYKTVTKEEELASLNAIVIDSYQSNIEIEPSKDDKIHITYQENSEFEVDYQRDKSTLRLKRKSQSFMDGFTLSWFDFTKDTTIQIHIELPKQYLGELTIDNSYRDIDIQDIQGLQNLEINNQNGAISLAKINANRIKVEGSYDDVSLTDVVSTHDMEIQLDQGVITMDTIHANALSLEASYSTLKADNLEILDAIHFDLDQTETELGDMKAQSLVVEATYGDVKAEKVDIGKSIRFTMDQSSLRVQQLHGETVVMESSYGDIEVYDLLASDIKIHTDQGSIMAMITDGIQNYAITSSSKYGDNNLPSKYHEEAEKHVDVTSEYGDINIDFKE